MPWDRQSHPDRGALLEWTCRRDPHRVRRGETEDRSDPPPTASSHPRSKTSRFGRNGRSRRSCRCRRRFPNRTDAFLRAAGSGGTPPRAGRSTARPCNRATSSERGRADEQNAASVRSRERSATSAPALQCRGSSIGLRVSGSWFRFGRIQSRRSARLLGHHGRS